MAVSLDQVVSYCQELLGVDQCPDYPGAHNGLQLQNQGEVTKIAAAVDAHLGVVREATEADADLLIVHHGLFWAPPIPLTGATYEKLRLAIEHNLAVYSCHLPLDRHEFFGNNILLSQALGLKNPQPFFYDNDQALGWKFQVEWPREVLEGKLSVLFDPSPTFLWHGPQTIRSIGILTGGGGSGLAKAAAEGVDTFLTGEGPQQSYGEALELGLNVIYAGHYATETFGVKALAQHLSEKWKLPWTFIDYPTGL